MLSSMRHWRFWLLDQERESAIREDLAAGLTRRAVLETAIGEVDAPHRVCAHRARMAGTCVNRETCPFGVFEISRWFARRMLDRRAQSVLHRSVERCDVVVTQARS